MQVVYFVAAQSNAVTATLVPSGRTVTERKYLAGNRDFLADAGRRHVPDPQPVIRPHRGHQPCPVGAEGQAHTTPGWGKVAHGSPVAASHKRTVLSQLPEASQRPSGLKATG